MDLGAGLLTTVLLTRYLKPELFGEYSWLVALILFFHPLVNFEINTILTREVAKEKQSCPLLFGNALSMKWIFSFLFACCIIVISRVLNLNTSMTIGLYAALGSEIFLQHCLIYSGIFNAFELMEFDTLLTFVFRLAALLGQIAVVVFDLGFTPLFYVMFLSGLIKFLLGTYIITRRFTPFKPRFDWEIIKSILSSSAVMTVASFLTSLSFRVDIYFLRALAGPPAVSLYNVPHTLVMQLQVIPAALTLALFPIFSRWGAENQASLRSAATMGVKILTLLGGIIGLNATLVSREIILLVSGNEFIDAHESLEILIWCAVILFLNYLVTYLLISLKMQRKLIVGAVVSLSINMILDFILIPHWKHLGAATATIIGYSSQLIIVFFFLYKGLGRLDLIRNFAAPLLAVLVPLIAGLLIRNFSVMISLAAANAFFLLIIFIFKIIGSREIRILRNFKKAVF